MREELQEWVVTYPTNPVRRDPAFTDAPVGDLLKRRLPAAIKRDVPAAAELHVKGSIGQSDWTHTPWVALLDPKMAVEDGVYVVYLLSHGCDRLYLSIAQGVTNLYHDFGVASADAELRRRADIMRPFVDGQTDRLAPLAMELESGSWRGPLYEASVVLGVEYDAADLPPEEDLVAELIEAITLYRQLTPIAAWQAESEILRQARDERGDCSFEEAKRYGQHRRIERRASHSKKVKKALGTRCMGCGLELSEQYGPKAAGVIDAHHLEPLSQLSDDESVKRDPAKDFAVLCPNCHRVIHRLDDPSDLSALREKIASYRIGN